MFFRENRGTRDVMNVAPLGDLCGLVRDGTEEGVRQWHGLGVRRF